MNLLNELALYDKENATPLLKEYFNLSVQAEDIVEISDIFIKQIKQMSQYLKEENLIVENLNLDYKALDKLFSNEDEELCLAELNKLENIFEIPKDFPAYNDLDYTPMILDGDYCIYDSSGARLFIVKEDHESQKIYMISRDRRQLNVQINEWLHDFIYDYKQPYILLKDTIRESDLIAEIQDGKLIKSSVDMKTMNLLQSYIVSELIEKGKIVDNILNLSFKELLENYTRQKGSYTLEERSIVPLLNSLIILNDKVTYEDFSKMPEIKAIKHESITDHCIEQLLEKDKNGKKLSYIYSKINLNKLKNLPNDYKKQINDYLLELLNRDSSENAKILYEIINQSLEISVNKKHKI